MAQRIETLPAQPGLPAPAEGRVYMDATLSPNRSLPNLGFTVLMITLVVASFTAGMAFVLMGAWPVFGFFGLDVLLVWAAFKFSYRQGRLRELIQVSAEGAQFARIAPNGYARHWRVAPQLARVQVDKPMKHDGQVRVTLSGRALILGAFLSPPERARFGAALRDAFNAARAERV